MTSPVSSNNDISIPCDSPPKKPIKTSSEAAEPKVVTSRETFSFEPRQAELAESRTITVERIYESPGIHGPAPRSLKFSPDGTRVTFLKGKVGDQRQMDLWEFNIQDQKSRVLVDSKELGSEEELSEQEKAHRERLRLFANGIVDYHWSRDGKSILFPLGNKLYFYDLEEKNSIELKLEGSGVDQKLSPASRYVSFIEKGNLFAYDIAAEKKMQLTHDGSGTVSNGLADFLAQEEMDRYTGYWWSGDDSRIAFIRVDEEPVELAKRCEIYADEVKVRKQRYPRAGTNNPDYTLGIVDLKSGETRWAELEKYKGWYMARVDWLPDNRHAALQMISRNQQKLDLIFIDTETMSSKRILRETSKTWINLHHDLTFIREGFIWSSEKSGYRHLYLYDMTGKLIKTLTKGNWQVGRIAGVDEEERIVYFEGFATSPIEKHLYKIGIDDLENRFERVTAERGWHRVNMAPDAKTFIDTYSDPRTPPQVSLRKSSGERIHYLEENRLDKSHPYFPYLANHSVPEFGTIKAEDGQQLHYSLTKPTHFDARKKYPVIITVYGGPCAQMVTNSWCAGQGGMWTQVMANKGYIVFSLDNRGSANKGKAFEDPIYLRMGHAEVEDQKSGAKFLKTLPYVDPERIGVFGWSYGGYMSLMMLFKEPKIFRTAAAVAPVTEWTLYDTFYTERYLGDPIDNPEGYEDSAVFSHVHNKIGNLLLVHGMADDNVLYTNTVKLVKEMQNKQVAFEMMDYPGSKHSISEKESRIHLFNMLGSFFDRKLSPRS